MRIEISARTLTSRRALRLAALLAALLFLLPLVGALFGPPSNLVVVASAPRIANGMTVAVGLPRSIFDDGEGNAYYVVSRAGEVLYPPGGGVGGIIGLTEGRGSAFIPYDTFVVDNGEYEVTVTYKDRQTMVRTIVDKWVNFVYVFPYLRNDTVVADVVLERASGQPNDRIFAAGQLTVLMYYRGANGTAEPQLRFTRSVEVTGLDSFTRVLIPLDSIERTDRNRGYYSVEGVFHNDQANGNNNVPIDPALAQGDPPVNWVYLELEDRCTGLVPEIPGVLPCPDPAR